MNNGCPICGLIHAPCEFRRGRPGVFPMRSVKRSRSATIATRWRNRRCGATVRGRSVRSPDARRVLPYPQTGILPAPGSQSQSCGVAWSLSGDDLRLDLKRKYTGNASRMIAIPMAESCGD